jgi:uncharacterized protein
MAAMLPVVALGFALSRISTTQTAGAPPASPIASYNAPLTAEQVDRRITAALGLPVLPNGPPPIRGTAPGSMQLAALAYPLAPPALPPPPVSPSVSVSVPRLLISLGTPPELKPVPTEPMVPRVPPVDLATPDVAPPGVVTVSPSVAAVPTMPAIASTEQCVARAPTSAVTHSTLAATSPTTFAASLVAAALEQTAGVSVYQARYVRIAYPGGDVSPFYGVCTDVVIRAYRALGIDLQQEVQKARVGRGDTSIDHRRTETLRLFFARMGETLPVTEFAEDYQPGDIVTYYRPQNRSSTAHIAIVSDVIAPSGRPMIIHNRGFGVQLEDGLFVDKITGHYRYRGPADAVAVAGVKPKVPAPTRVALRSPQASPQSTTLSRPGGTLPTGISVMSPLRR